MVFQFEHVAARPGPGGKWDVRPLRLRRPEGSRSAAGRTGLADVGWNSLYWNNHDQPRAVSRFGDDGEHRVRLGQAARHGAAPAPRHAVRLPGRGARHDERAVRRDRATSATSSRSTTTPTAVAAGADPDDGAGRAARDEPRQRAHADAVGRLAARRLHHRRRRGSRSTRTTRDQRRGRSVADPDSVFHHYRRADRAAARRAGRRARRLHDAAARRTSASTRSRGATRRPSCSCWPTSPARR